MGSHPASLLSILWSLVRTQLWNTPEFKSSFLPFVVLWVGRLISPVSCFLLLIPQEWNKGTSEWETMTAVTHWEQWLSTTRSHASFPEDLVFMFASWFPNSVWVSGLWHGPSVASGIQTSLRWGVYLLTCKEESHGKISVLATDVSMVFKKRSVFNPIS